MSLFIHKGICPECGYEDAILNNDTSGREVWVECPHCGHGLLSHDDLADLDFTGYTDPEERAAILDAIDNYPTPYNSNNDMLEKIRWAEFCKALKEVDFTPGDNFALNGIAFTVGTYPDKEAEVE